MEFADVKNTTGFFKEESGKWVMKVKSMYENIKLLFGLNTLRIQVAEGAEVYRFVVEGKKKFPIGYIIYTPFDKRIEVWEGDLLLRYKGKTLEYCGVSEFIMKAGFGTLFNRLTNIA